MPFQMGEEDPNGSLEAFYGANSERLRRYVGKRVNAQVAEDLCQSAWLAFFPKWERYRYYDSPLAVLLKIAKRLIADWYDDRRGEELPGGDEIDQLAGELLLRCPDLSGDDVRIDLKAALAGLTERQRDAISLRYVDDLDRKTVAAELGITVDGVKKALRTALLKLRESGLLAGYECIDEQGEEGQE